jgi:Flavodoxin-like fold
LTCINCRHPAVRYLFVVSRREGQVRHLVIAAHPNTKSFNHSVAETYVAALEERKHRVECRDLYASNFNPVMSARDLAAIGHGRASKDIRDEQAAIRRADVLTFISPLWWSGFPDDPEGLSRPRVLRGLRLFNQAGRVRAGTWRQEGRDYHDIRR